MLLPLRCGPADKGVACVCLQHGQGGVFRGEQGFWGDQNGLLQRTLS